VPDAREVERLRKLETLAELLPMIGRSLDVREVFDRVSEGRQARAAARRVCAGAADEDRERVRIYAVSADADFSPPEAIPCPRTSASSCLGEAWEFIILDDMLADDRWRTCRPARAGYRTRFACRSAWTTGPARRHQLHEPGAARVLGRRRAVARRVADCVALALSHQRLAEEAQRAAAARERAAQLERRVKALTDELASLSGSGRRWSADRRPGSTCCTRPRAWRPPRRPSC